jgi:hypothetical protein
MFPLAWLSGELFESVGPPLAQGYFVHWPAWARGTVLLVISALAAVIAARD